MRFGLHISIEGGVEKAPARAHDAGCECFQIFSRSPHGGKSKAIGEEVAEKFKSELEKSGIGKFFIHSPYYINFASENNRIRYGTISAIKSEMETADLLGACGVVTHLGSAKDLGKEADRILVEGLCKVFALPRVGKTKAGYKKYRAKLLLEITAGSGNIMGDTFEEIAYFIREAEKELGKDTLGVCFDTAHAFASGYDLRTAAAVRKTFAAFDKTVGLDRIKLVHLNDSEAAIDSHVDRHANIGEGQIGIEGITAILGELKTRGLDFVLETPPPRSSEDLEIVKRIRDAS